MHPCRSSGSKHGNSYPIVVASYSAARRCRRSSFLPMLRCAKFRITLQSWNKTMTVRVAQVYAIIVVHRLVIYDKSKRFTRHSFFYLLTQYLWEAFSSVRSNYCAQTVHTVFTPVCGEVINFTAREWAKWSGRNWPGVETETRGTQVLLKDSDVLPLLSFPLCTTRTNPRTIICHAESQCITLCFFPSTEYILLEINCFPIYDAHRNSRMHIYTITYPRITCTHKENNVHWTHVQHYTRYRLTMFLAWIIALLITFILCSS